MPARHLMVEGRDDWYVIQNLLKCNGVAVRPQAEKEVELRSGEASVKMGYSDYGESGVEELIKVLPTRLKQSGLRRLAVVLDANSNLQARWTSIHNVMKRAGAVSPPEQPSPSGTTFILREDLTVGVWLMPDNRTSGMLEDFTSMLVPHDDVLLPQVDDFLDGLSAHPRRFKDTHRAKARIHTWLALQADPGKPLGLAITMKFLDGNAASAKPFLAWFRSLMIDDP